jgi:hypothetical protein
MTEGMDAKRGILGILIIVEKLFMRNWLKCHLSCGLSEMIGVSKIKISKIIIIFRIYGTVQFDSIILFPEMEDIEKSRDYFVNILKRMEEDLNKKEQV